VAVNDRFTLRIQGTFCGALFSWNFAYQQIQPDVVGVNPGLSLVQAWIDADVSPWRSVRPFLSAELTLVCADWSTGENIGSAAVSGTFASGADAVNAPLPPTVAILIHEWAAAPHLDNYAGRFYLTGLTVALADGPALAQALVVAFAPFLSQLVTIGPNAQNSMFRMIPSLEFEKNAIVPTGSSEFVGVCFADPLLRRIKSRLPDHCAIVAAQGAPIGMPGLVVEEVPEG